MSQIGASFNFKRTEENSCITLRQKGLPVLSSLMNFLELSSFIVYKMSVTSAQSQLCKLMGKLFLSAYLFFIDKRKEVFEKCCCIVSTVKII